MVEAIHSWSFFWVAALPQSGSYAMTLGNHIFHSSQENSKKIVNDHI